MDSVTGTECITDMLRTTDYPKEVPTRYTAPPTHRRIASPNLCHGAGASPLFRCWKP